MPMLQKTAMALLMIASVSVAAAQEPKPQPAPAQLPSVTLSEDLARVLTDYSRAWGAGDARGLAALFTEDGFVLSNGRPPVRGRAAIEKHYTGSGGSSLFLRALAFATKDDVGYIIGAYSSSSTGPDIGKFTLTLRKESGRWLIMSDMDNGNAPRR